LLVIASAWGWNSVRAAGLSARRARSPPGWLRRHTHAIQIFGGALTDRGRVLRYHRRVERLRLLAAGRLRQRREVADLMRLLIAVIARARNTWRALTSMGTALVLLCLLALGRDTRGAAAAAQPQRGQGR